MKKNISSSHQAAGNANPKLGLKLPLRTNLGETIGLENWVHFSMYITNFLMDVLEWPTNMIFLGSCTKSSCTLHSLNFPVYWQRIGK
jgi:hypothetical protein